MIAISIVLGAVAQVFLKYGLGCVTKNRHGEASINRLVRDVILQPFIWLWGLCFVAATALWVLGLQKVDLSYAFPLLSCSYILVSVLSAVFFREQVDRNRWLAVLVISFGVVLIAGT
jgi:drug/metabolite transporter (DMT)-like permease